MSTAYVTVTLGTTPTANVCAGQEVVEAFAATNSETPVNFLIRARAGSSVASSLLQKQKDQFLLVTGELIPNEDTGETVLLIRTVNDAHEGQFINEANVMGRCGGRIREAAKSSSIGVAVNRYDATQSDTEPHWFRIRGFGKLKDRVDKLTSGDLVEVSGMLTAASNKEGKQYLEVKTRFLKVHLKKGGGGGGQSNPAPKSNAAGMDDSDFLGDDMPFS